MKRVLKEGKISKNVRKFRCPNCGCVFEADEDDYATIRNARDDFCSFVESECPTCHKKVYIDEDWL